MVTTIDAIDLPTPTEEATRDSFVAVVKQGQAVFLEVGNALLQLKERRLYRFTHGTFEDFCKAEFGFTRRWAYMLCSSAEVVETVKEDARKMGTIVPIPQTESQARPLAKLPKSEQSQAWADAVASAPDGKPTAKHVEKIVQERISTTKPTAKKFVCRYCYGNQLSDDGECCERCKEPVKPPKKAAAFDFDRAFFKTSDMLAKIDDLWPETEKQAMVQQVSNWVNQVRRSLRDSTH